MRTGTALPAVALMLAACGGGDGSTGPTVLSIVLTAPTQTIALGDPVQLVATARDVNGVTVPGLSFAYNVSAPTVLNVSASGQAVGIAPGTAAVTATASGVTSPPLTITVSPSASVGAVVTMPNISFSPSTVTIKAGQSVVFVFPALAHEVAFENRPGKPDDIPTTVNAAVPRKFEVAGTFPYRCLIHPGMNGQVIVNP